MDAVQADILLKEEAEKLFHNLIIIRETEQTEQKENYSARFCFAGENVEMTCDQKLLKDYFLWQMGLFRIPNSYACSYRVNIRCNTYLDSLFRLMRAEKIRDVRLVLFDNDDPIRLYAECIGPLRIAYAYRESVKEGWAIIDPSSLNPFMNLSAVMSPLFSYMFEKSGILLLHSAAVVCRGRAVLLPGVSRSGKSTLAAACLLNGMEYISDDTILLRISEHTVFPLCTTIHLMPDTLSVFSEFAKMTKNEEIRTSGENKEKCHLNISCFSDQFAAGAEAGLVVRPRIRENMYPEIVPADKKSIMAELLYSSTRLLGEEKNQVYRSRAAKEIGRMECYDFLLSGNIRDNASYLKNFLEKIF